MKKKDISSVDGFIPRRPRSELGELQNLAEKRTVSKQYRPLHSGDNVGSNRVGVARDNYALGEAAKEYDEARKLNKSDINEALNQIGDDEPKKKGFGKRKKSQFDINPKKKSKTRRIVKWVVIALIVAILAVGGYFVYTVMKAGGDIFQGNIFNLLQHKPLKEDSNGRSNFLIVGTSEDDPGHEGANLTDSIMVVSVDQTKKDAYMFSVPRDLYVEYDRACLSGYRGKINVFFSCVNAEDTPEAEQERLAETQKKIGDLFGLDIQYGVHVNYTVVRDVINAIGGSITVNIEGNGPTPDGIPAGSIMDANFDWKCGATTAERITKCPPRGHFIDYGPGPQELDAEHALYLAQARGDSWNWGLVQSNFDREKNQQKVLMAIREKALSAGTLTNLGAVTGLINALGSNLRTNIQTDEIRTLMDLASNISSDAIRSISLIDAEPQLLSTGSPIEGAGSIVYPTAGIYDFTAIQSYIAKRISSDPVVMEEASISVLNGSGESGVASEAANKLRAKKFTITEVGDAPDGNWNVPITIYQLNDNNPGTANALADFYNVKLKTEQPPFSVVGELDFIVIVGSSA